MECIDRRASIAVDGFYLSILTCLLDYVITRTVERGTGLCTIIDYSNSMTEQIKLLEILRKDFDTNFSRKVVFTRMREVRDYNTFYGSSILISYTGNGRRLPDCLCLIAPFCQFPLLR